MTSDWQKLNERIADCQACGRLVKHCQKVAKNKRRAYVDEDYWGRPVPNMGPSRASLLIVGLAPGAHGANRTGRMFTGDRSGDWLFKALHRAGFANQAESSSQSDGLKLKNCVITAVCHCAPPDNKPTTEETHRCAPFLDQTIRELRPRVFLALCGLARKAFVKHARRQDWLHGPQPKFSHGSFAQLNVPRRRKRCWLLGSYHPSQQNTFTGRLTEPMLNDIFHQANQLISEP